jgi:hypothetical protein
MSFSFAKIDFWKLIVLGLALELTHLVLRNHWQDLAPHHQHGAWAATLLISEYVLLLATLLAAAGTVSAMLKNRNFSGAILVVCAWLAYFGLFAWVLSPHGSEVRC